VVPIEVIDEDETTKLVKQDESPRRNTSLEKLASLAPLHDGTTTAGNACPINDGAAAVMLMAREKAEELNLKAKAVVVSQAVVGVEPVMCLEGPIYATPKCLERAGLTLDDIDLMEVNEAFSSVVIATGKILGFDPLSDKRLAVHGGSLALGHPLGASGARLITTILHALEDRNLRYGLVTMCCGLGLGTATIIERE
jgi:acetyl-CoA acyltransferase